MYTLCRNTSPYIRLLVFTSPEDGGSLRDLGHSAQAQGPARFAANPWRFLDVFDVFWAPKPWESHLCFDGKPILGPSGFSQLE